MCYILSASSGKNKCYLMFHFPQEISIWVIFNWYDIQFDIIWLINIFRCLKIDKLDNIVRIDFAFLIWMDRKWLGYFWIQYQVFNLREVVQKELTFSSNTWPRRLFKFCCSCDFRTQRHQISKFFVPYSVNINLDRWIHVKDKFVPKRKI